MCDMTLSLNGFMLSTYSQLIERCKHMALMQRRRKYSSSAEFEGEFFAIHTVRTGPRIPGTRRRALRVGPLMPVRGDRRHQLWNTDSGIFLAGATPEQARQWAARHAARIGGTLTGEERHGRTGLPHIHIVGTGDLRSAHIFYGAAPAGDFFDYPY
jgi:hypothetical protein